MHSRIFQISKEPIPKYDYIEEDKYYDHWFTNSIADYVDGDTDREDDIQWFKECYKDRGLLFDVDDAGEYFIVKDKVKYFALKFETFKNEHAELQKLTLEDFISGKGSLNMYRLKEAYCDEAGFYVDGGGYGLVALDELVRQTNVDIKYYIGATIDYHY